MANAQKDLAYYTQMAADSQSAHAIADAVHSAYALAARRLGPRAMVPELMALLSQRGSLP